jgi:Skp family chaperone for outer membrane proteins
MKAFAFLILGLLAFGAMSLATRGCAYVNRAADVAAAQVDPATLLKRYEWFKDAAAQLDKKKADIAVNESRLTQLKQSYEGKSRSEWAREDREQANVWAMEVAGMQASFNGLAAEYNAAMAKANYAFTNIGELPKGAAVPLPREFKAYVTGN